MLQFFPYRKLAFFSKTMSPCLILYRVRVISFLMMLVGGVIQTSWWYHWQCWHRPWQSCGWHGNQQSVCPSPWRSNFLLHHCIWWWEDSVDGILFDQEARHHCPNINFLSPLLHYMCPLLQLPLLHLHCPLLKVPSFCFRGVQWLRQGYNHRQLLYHFRRLHHLEWLNLLLLRCPERHRQQ